MISATFAKDFARLFKTKPDRLSRKIRMNNYGVPFARFSKAGTTAAP